MSEKARPFLFKTGTTTIKAPRLKFANGTLTFVAGEAVYTAPSGGGGGGTWAASGITGTHNRIAGFDSGGAATYYTGAAIVGLAATHAGDLLYGDGAGGASRLPIGAANRLLLSDGSAPSWASPSDVRTALSLVVGTNVQAWDADLDAFAALASDGVLIRSTTWQIATLTAPLQRSGTTLSVAAATTSAAGVVQLATDGEEDATKAVKSDDSRLSGTGGIAGSVAVTTTYGSGRNGVAAFDGVNPVTGWSLAGSTYTYTGAVDPHYTTVTVSAGVTLVVAGFRFLCHTFTAGNNVTISASGAAASGTTAGTGAAPATLWTSTTGAVFFGGQSGAAGRATNANGINAGAIAAGAGYLGGLGGRSGRARYTAGSGIATAGTAGTGTSLSAYPHYSGDPFNVLYNAHPIFRNGTSFLQAAGGTGGGGGPLTTAGTSGGGGGGGGVLTFAAANASFGTGCVFRADGGAGAAGSAGTDSSAAGGGGGGGGRVQVLIGNVSGSNLPSFSAIGGNGGAGSCAGTGYWAEGGDGGTGGKVEVFFGTNGPGGTPTMTVTGGTGGAGAGNTGGSLYVGSANGAAGTSSYTEGA